MSADNVVKLPPPRPKITAANYAQYQNIRSAIAGLIRSHLEARLDRIRAENAADRTERALQAQQRFAMMRAR